MAKKKKGILGTLFEVIFGKSQKNCSHKKVNKKSKTRKKNARKKPSKKRTASGRVPAKENNLLKQQLEPILKSKPKRKIVQRKNVSKEIPNGRTLQTRDEYFEGDGDYRKPGYENKGLYRGAVVVDSNRNNDLAVIVLTKSEKGEDVPGRKNSKYRPFIETKDDKGQPIRIGEKFKENKPSKDLSPEAVKTIKKLTFKDAGNAQENRDKVREMKGRNKK